MSLSPHTSSAPRRSDHKISGLIDNGVGKHEPASDAGDDLVAALQRMPCGKVELLPMKDFTARSTVDWAGTVNIFHHKAVADFHCRESHQITVVTVSGCAWGALRNENFLCPRKL